MTLTDRTWRWLGIAPPVVVLSICLVSVSGLASWTWVLAEEVRDQRTTAALALEKAESARAVSAATASTVEARLNRLEDKLDRLLDGVDDLRSGQRALAREKKK